MRLPSGIAAALSIMVFACSPAPIGSPAAGLPTPTHAESPSARPSGSEIASSQPTIDVEATTPPSGTDPPSATEAPLPPVELTADEEGLVSELREDARVDCRPRRDDLPDRAVIGVECSPSDDLVARVGIYEFANDRDAALAYLDRMSEAGVAPGSGSCIEGRPGDAAWTGGDGEGSVDDEDAIVVDGQTLVGRRSGCFHDENGTANFRATCWMSHYVGVLGRTPDIAALEDWSWAYPRDVEPSTPGPPGVCPYEPGLGPGSEGTGEGDG